VLDVTQGVGLGSLYWLGFVGWVGLWLWLMERQRSPLESGGPMRNTIMEFCCVP